MIDFDRMAKNWDSIPKRTERALAVAEAIRASLHLSPAMRALEYGCGTGLLSFALQLHLGHITLADSSPGMLAVLEEKIKSGEIHNMTPLKLDLSTDPVPEERYHLIYTLMTLHHIPDTDKVLRGFYTLLVNHGYLCIADLDKEDGSFHGAGFDGHNGFDRAELGDRLTRIGFRDIHFATCYQTTKEVETGVKTFSLFLMTAQKGPYRE
jgi:ubiquinone/menaquinone biosynthesis C-methylase UbiE